MSSPLSLVDFLCPTLRFSKNSAVTKCKFSFYLPSLTTAQGLGGREVSLATFLGDEKLSLPPSLLPSSSDVVVHENETSPKIAEKKREQHTSKI